MPLYPPTGGGGVTIEEVIDTLYPVGSIYISTLATNPGTLLGRGTWAIFGAGRVLVGMNSADVDFDTLEETGGAKTHTLVIGEIPAHTHDVPLDDFGVDVGLAIDTQTSQEIFQRVTSSTGGNGAHNNLQPYIVVAAWKRTA